MSGVKVSAAVLLPLMLTLLILPLLPLLRSQIALRPFAQLPPVLALPLLVPSLLPMTPWPQPRARSGSSVPSLTLSLLTELRLKERRLELFFTRQGPGKLPKTPLLPALSLVILLSLLMELRPKERGLDSSFTRQGPGTLLKRPLLKRPLLPEQRLPDLPQPPKPPKLTEFPKLLRLLRLSRLLRPLRLPHRPALQFGQKIKIKIRRKPPPYNFV